MRSRVFLKKLKKRLLITLIMLIVAFSLLFAFIDGRLTPMMRTLAVSFASRFINDVTSAAVAEYITENGITADRLARVGDDETNPITLDTAAVNLLSCGVSALISSRLTGCEESFSVPVGNLLSTSLLAGKGPEITVRLIFTGRLSCEYNSSLSSAGINQTLYRVTLRFTVGMAAVVGARAFDVESTAESVVCEAVINGKVPSVYLGNTAAQGG